MDNKKKSKKDGTVSTGRIQPIGKATRKKAPKPSIYEEAPETSRLAAIYARVSTLEQAEGESVDIQERLCREYIKREKPGWKVVEVFRDEGHSGKSDQREGFQKMLDAIDEGKVNAVVCHHLDRFSRNLHDIMVHFKRLEDDDVFLSFADENFDFSTPEGRMHFNILAVFADWYLKNLSRETRKVKASTVFNGRQNNQVPFGYAKNELKKAVIIPEEAEIIQQVFEMYTTGNYSDGEIANWINDQGIPTRKNKRWTKESVRTTLQLDFYYGVVKYKDQLYPGEHEPIVEKKLFDEVQLLRKKRHRSPRSNSKKFTRVYVLQDLLVCASCGRNLRVQGSGKNYRYYYENSKRRGLECADLGAKMEASIAEEQIGKIIQAFQLPDDWKKEIQTALDAGNDRKQIEERIKKLKLKQERLSELYVDQMISKSEYQKRRDRLRAEQDQLILPAPEKVFDSGEQIKSFKQVWKLADLSEQKEMCRILFDRIILDMAEERVIKIFPRRGFSIFFEFHPNLTKNEEGGYDVKGSF